MLTLENQKISWWKIKIFFENFDFSDKVIIPRLSQLVAISQMFVTWSFESSTQKIIRETIEIVKKKKRINIESWSISRLMTYLEDDSHFWITQNLLLIKNDSIEKKTSYHKHNQT